MRIRKVMTQCIGFLSLFFLSCLSFHLLMSRLGRSILGYMR